MIQITPNTYIKNIEPTEIAPQGDSFSAPQRSLFHTILVVALQSLQLGQRARANQTLTCTTLREQISEKADIAYKNAESNASSTFAWGLAGSAFSIGGGIFGAVGAQALDPFAAQLNFTPLANITTQNQASTVTLANGISQGISGVGSAFDKTGQANQAVGHGRTTRDQVETDLARQASESASGKKRDLTEMNRNISQIIEEVLRKMADTSRAANSAFRA